MFLKIALIGNVVFWDLNGTGKGEKIFANTLGYIADHRYNVKINKLNPSHRGNICWRCHDTIPFVWNITPISEHTYINLFIVDKFYRYKKTKNSGVVVNGKMWYY